MATRAEGFRTIAELTPALAFHAVISTLGVQLLLLAVRRADAQRPQAAAVTPAGEGAPNS